MDAVVYYCKTCHFEEPALAIARELEEQLGIRCEVRRAFWGTFKVELEGREIYNRWKAQGWLGRIGLAKAPQPDEVVSLIRSRLSDPNPESQPATR